METLTKHSDAFQEDPSEMGNPIRCQSWKWRGRFILKAQIYIYMHPPRDRPFSLISLAHDILSSKVSLTESTTLHMTQEGYELT